MDRAHTMSPTPFFVALWTEPNMSRARKPLAGTLLALLALGVAATLFSWFALPETMAIGNGRHVVRARVCEVPAPTASQVGIGIVVHGRHEEGAGRTVWVEPPAGMPPTQLSGQTVFVEFQPDGHGTIIGIARDRVLFWLAVVVLGLMVLVSGTAAWRFLLVLAAGLAALPCLFVPCVFKGLSPIFAAIITAVVFQGVASLLIGRNGRCSWGIFAGSMGGLLVAGVLSLMAVHAAWLTGVYSSLTQTLWYAPQTQALNFRQLLAGGMIIGACGVILDLAAGITLAVHQVARANALLGRRQLMRAGLAVGRDIMGTELNTLIFAYAGAHVGMLLLPLLSAAVTGHEICALQMFSEQDVAVEVLAILIGTTALILTIPITAVTGALLLAARQPPGVADAALPAGGAGRARAWWLAAAVLFLAAWLGALHWHGARFHRYESAGQTGPVRALVQATVVSADPPGVALAARPGRPTGEVLQRVRCVLTSGTQCGTAVEVNNAISGFPGHDKLLNAHDPVLLQTWSDQGRVIYGAVIDFSRGGRLIHFAFLLIAVVLLVGRMSGLRALAALLVCGMILYATVVLVAAGGRRVPVQPLFLGAVLMLCICVFAIIAGPTRKAAIGAAGAFSGLAVGGACVAVLSGLLGLSGLEGDAAMAIRTFTHADLDYPGLLQAGMVLGLAGCVMDVAIAIASATHEVARAKPDIARWELFLSGMRVGNGVMVPMVVVLAFAYAGLNLPILMLPQLLPEQPVTILLSNERIAVEALRILVGGMSLVATVPATALFASLWKRNNAETHDAMA